MSPGKTHYLVLGCSKLKAAHQLIIFLDFWAKILRITHPVNYSYLPPIPKASKLAKNSVPKPLIGPKFTSNGYILLRNSDHLGPKQSAVVRSQRPLCSALRAAHLYQTESQVPPPVNA